MAPKKSFAWDTRSPRGGEDQVDLYASKLADHVRNLIEQCLKRYMTRDKTAAHLEEQERIPSWLTIELWVRMERENTEFFRHYNERLKITEQINWFNQLLELQYRQLLALRYKQMGNPAQPVVLISSKGNASHHDSAYPNGSASTSEAAYSNVSDNHSFGAYPNRSSSTSEEAYPNGTHMDPVAAYPNGTHTHMDPVAAYPNGTHMDPVAAYPKGTHMYPVAAYPNGSLSQERVHR